MTKKIKNEESKENNQENNNDARKKWKERQLKVENKERLKEKTDTGKK